jgi:phosphoribosylformylglycinamidine cyclo-ligase
MDDDRLGRPLGDVLLEPTAIYVRAALELLESDVDVRGLAHITGDGLNNLLRLSREVGYALSDPLDVPPVFGLIQELGGVSDEEMQEVFNMGLGFVCVVAADDAGAAAELLAGHHPGARPIGSVTGDAGNVRRN